MLQLYRKLFLGTGYAFEALGSASQLRELTVEQIRAYHSMYYHPENLTIFISGRVSAEGVLEAIADIEEKIISKAATRTAFDNEWKPNLQPLEETIIETVYYPNDEEANATIFVGWRGPNPITEYETLQACLVLLHYLCSSPISPVRRDLMEIDEPVASQIDFQIIEHAQAVIRIKLTGVPTDRIADVDALLMSVISGTVTGAETFDMDRMRIIIQNYFYENELNEMEKQPHLHIFHKIVPTILYGGKLGETDVSRFNLNHLTTELLAKSNQDWIEILQKYFIQASPY